MVLAVCVGSVRRAVDDVVPDEDVCLVRFCGDVGDGVSLDVFVFTSELG